MGFAVSWICVQGHEPSAVKDALSLEHVGTVEEPFEAHYTGLDLGRRGYLIAINETIDPLVEDAAIQSLSTRWTVIACQVEDHSMHCVSQGWSNGKKDWLIEHNAQLGLMHLSAIGDVPAQFGPIKKQAFERQQASDDDIDHLFEVPSFVAWRLTGFKHDRRYVLRRGKSFEDLSPIKLAQAGRQNRKNGEWWKFW